MTIRRRLEQLEHAARERAGRDNRPMEEWTDAELLALLGFPPGSNPTDEELRAAVGGPGKREGEKSAP